MVYILSTFHKNQHNIIIYYFALILLAKPYFTNSTCNFIAPFNQKVLRPIKLLTKFGLSSGPLWIAAYKNSRLLITSYAEKILGNESIDPFLESEIRQYLQKAGYKQWKTIKIKKLNKKSQQKTLDAILSTCNIIFVNPMLYQHLNAHEKLAIITKNTLLLSSNYLALRIAAFITIPCISSALLSTYEKLYKYIFIDNDEDDTDFLLSFNRLHLTHLYFSNSWITKLCTNILLAKAYLSQEEITSNLNTINQLGSASGLISYLIKMHDRKESEQFLNSIIKLDIRV